MMDIEFWEPVTAPIVVILRVWQFWMNFIWYVSIDLYLVVFQKNIRNLSTYVNR